MFYETDNFKTESRVNTLINYFSVIQKLPFSLSHFGQEPVLQLASNFDNDF